ncbi:MAG: hypothetical protein KC621_26390 [Myxococcales bacterium]|nr:hypothetical protein [Myxococcales bacterium]
MLWVVVGVVACGEGGTERPPLAPITSTPAPTPTPAPAPTTQPHPYTTGWTSEPCDVNLCPRSLVTWEERERVDVDVVTVGRTTIGDCYLYDVSVVVPGAPGVTVLEDDWVRFVPTEPLLPDASYVAEATIEAECQEDVCSATCIASTSVPLTTWATVDPAASVGVAYAQPWGAMRFTDPWPSSVVVLDVDAVVVRLLRSLDRVLVGSTTAGSADCGTLTTWVADLSANPVVRASGELTLQRIGGGTLRLRDAEIDAVLTNDGASLARVDLTGLVPPDDLEEGATCADIPGARCEPCDVPSHCVRVRASATDVPRADLLGSCR